MLFVSFFLASCSSKAFWFGASDGPCQVPLQLGVGGRSFEEEARMVWGVVRVVLVAMVLGEKHDVTTRRLAV